MQSDTVIIEHTYAAPISKVWTALTDPAQMKQWYFDVPDFRPEVGCEFDFHTASGEIKKHLLCRVTEVDPGRKISYTWKYAGHGGESHVTFALSELAGQTHLRITHVGLASLPLQLTGIGFHAGWTYFAAEALPEFLMKNE